jgi:transcriptional antiterminator RfaH
MKEEFLSIQLCSHKIDTFFPSIRVKPSNPRAKKVKAYFPGYVFARMKLEQIHQPMFRWLPGLAGIVSVDGIPSHLPDSLIHAIRQRVDEINDTGEQGLDEVKPGTLVSIQEGPFEGYEAILDSGISGYARVKLLLNLLDGSHVRVEIPGRQIRLLKQ